MAHNPFFPPTSVTTTSTTCYCEKLDDIYIDPSVINTISVDKTIYIEYTDCSGNFITLSYYLPGPHGAGFATTDIKISFPHYPGEGKSFCVLNGVIRVYVIPPWGGQMNLSGGLITIVFQSHTHSHNDCFIQGCDLNTSTTTSTTQNCSCKKLELYLSYNDAINSINRTIFLQYIDCLGQQISYSFNVTADVYLFYNECTNGNISDVYLKIWDDVLQDYVPANYSYAIMGECCDFTTTTTTQPPCYCYLIEINENTTTTTTTASACNDCRYVDIVISDLDLNDQNNFAQVVELRYFDCGGNSQVNYYGFDTTLTDTVCMCVDTNPELVYFDDNYTQYPASNSTFTLTQSACTSQLMFNSSPLTLTSCTYTGVNCEGISFSGTLNTGEQVYVCSQTPPESTECSLNVTFEGSCGGPYCPIITGTTTTTIPTPATRCQCTFIKNNGVSCVISYVECSTGFVSFLPINNGETVNICAQSYDLGLCDPQNVIIHQFGLCDVECDSPKCECYEVRNVNFQLNVCSFDYIDCYGQIIRLTLNPLELVQYCGSYPIEVDCTIDSFDINQVGICNQLNECISTTTTLSNRCLCVVIRNDGPLCNVSFQQCYGNLTIQPINSGETISFCCENYTLGDCDSQNLVVYETGLCNVICGDIKCFCFNVTNIDPQSNTCFIDYIDCYGNLITQTINFGQTIQYCGNYPLGGDCDITSFNIEQVGICDGLNNCITTTSTTLLCDYEGVDCNGNPFSGTIMDGEIIYVCSSGAPQSMMCILNTNYVGGCFDYPCATTTTTQAECRCYLIEISSTTTTTTEPTTTTTTAPACSDCRYVDIVISDLDLNDQNNFAQVVELRYFDCSGNPQVNYYGFDTTLTDTVCMCVDINPELVYFDDVYTQYTASNSTFTLTQSACTSQLMFNSSPLSVNPCIYSGVDCSGVTFNRVITPGQQVYVCSQTPPQSLDCVLDIIDLGVCGVVNCSATTTINI